MMRSLLSLTAGLALVTSAALAGPSIRLNEIYASHSGTDDREFIELIGSGSLDNLAIVVVEGDAPAAGTIDRVWDLTGNTMPADGFFVVGDDGVPNLDLSVGTSNTLENGTETFYLLNVTDLAGLSALVGTDLDTNDDGIYDGTAITDFGSIVDIVAMVDTGFGTGDQVYDGAPVRGPDGTFFPAGIYRFGDYPNDWATDFLNFDDSTIGGTAPDRPTPGLPNVPEPASLMLIGLGALALGRSRR